MKERESVALAHVSPRWPPSFFLRGAANKQTNEPRSQTPIVRGRAILFETEIPPHIIQVWHRRARNNRVTFAWFCRSGRLLPSGKNQKRKPAKRQRAARIIRTQQKPSPERPDAHDYNARAMEMMMMT